MTVRDRRLRRDLANPKSARRRPTMIESLEARSMLSASIVTTAIDNGGLTPGRRGHASGDYQLGGRWTSTATNASTGSNGSPITLTWGFVPDGLSINGYNGEATSDSNLIAKLNEVYTSQATWLPLFQSVFDSWSAVTGVTYVYQPTDDGASFDTGTGQLGVRADVRIGGHAMDGPFGILAYNFYPGTENGGNMVIDTSDFNAATPSSAAGVFRNLNNNSRALRNTLAHEHGHGLGLAHTIPTDHTKLMEPFLNTNFDGQQFDDILGAQSYYGDAYEKGTRNETAANAFNLGALAAGQVSLVSNASTFIGDVDYFKFSLASSRTVGLTLSPVGTTYLQGPQNGSVSNFNASLRANLALNVYAADGTTLLQSANLNGYGLAETINLTNLAAGTYVVRVSGSGPGAQMYQLTASDAAVIPPVAPVITGLAAGSDSGDSAADGITNVITPTFTGTAAPGSNVTLFNGSTAFITVTADVNGNWSAAGGMTFADDDTYLITAKATTAFGGSSLASNLFDLTIDTVAPTFTISYDREVTQHFILTFESNNVASKLALDEVTLTLDATPAGVLTPGQSVPLTTISVNGSQAIVGAASLLADGRFRLSVVAGAVTDVAGNASAAPAPLLFSQLAGDADNNGTVDFQDLVVLAQNYNATGKTFSQGNFNYDPAGNVDFQDLVLLAQRYNVSLPAIVAPVISSPPLSLIATTGSGGTITRKKQTPDFLS